jgi:hypothetical protein
MRGLASGLSSAALIGVLFAGHAGADEGCALGPAESARERAKGEYASGRAAYEGQRYREAIDHLLCANRVVPSAELAYNIAVTYETMGDAASALRWYRDYRRQGGTDADSAPIREKVAELEGTLQALGVQQVTVSSTPAGAMLRIDEQAVGLTPFTLELKPGRHSYRLTSEGRTSVGGTFELRPDRSLDVALELPPVPVPPPAAVTLAPPATAVRVTEPSPIESIGTWTWISLGAGTLLLGGALGLELRRRQLDAELSHVSQARYPDRYDAMSAHQTAARVSLGVGAAALAVGGVLLVLDVRPAAAVSEVRLGARADGGPCLAAGGVF